MSDTANETKLREAIKQTLQGADDLSSATIQRLRKVLAETEPKHPAELLFEEWWVNHSRGWVVKDEVRKTAMHFFRAGMLASIDLVEPGACHLDTIKRIRDAAEKVPV